MIQQFNFAIGDTVQVYQKIREGEKTRTQIFEGIVVKMHGRGEGKTFMVRKYVGQIAVERIWPINAPLIEQVKVKSKARNNDRIKKI